MACEHYACFVRAERTEGQFLRSLDPAAGAPAVAALLSEQVASGLRAGGKTDAASLVTFYQGELAQDLRNYVNQHGVPALLSRGNALMFSHRYSPGDCGGL